MSRDRIIAPRAFAELTAPPAPLPHPGQEGILIEAGCGMVGAIEGRSIAPQKVAFSLAASRCRQSAAQPFETGRKLRGRAAEPQAEEPVVHLEAAPRDHEHSVPLRQVHVGPERASSNRPTRHRNLAGNRGRSRRSRWLCGDSGPRECAWCLRVEPLPRPPSACSFQPGPARQRQQEHARQDRALAATGAGTGGRRAGAIVHRVSEVYGEIETRQEPARVPRELRILQESVTAHVVVRFVRGALLLTSQMTTVILLCTSQR